MSDAFAVGNSLVAPLSESSPAPTWLEPAEAVTLVLAGDAAQTGHEPNGLPQEPRRRGINPRVLVLAFGVMIVFALGVYLTFSLVLPSRIDQALKNLRADDAAKSKPALQLLFEANPQDSDRTKVTVALETLL